MLLCLQDGDYATAARLAFQLRHPGRLLEVLRRQPGGPAAALTALQGLVGKLEAADLATALSYCRLVSDLCRQASQHTITACICLSYLMLGDAGSYELVN